MGRSAKLHKRVHKSANASSQPPPAQAAQSQPAVTRKTTSTPSSKKRKDLKSKAARQIKEDGKSGVLGGADYVTLMLGGRRKAKEEAKRLPPPEGAMSSLSL